MNNIAKLANDFLNRNGIKKLSLTPKELIKIIEGMGFDVVFYSEGKQLIEKARLRKYTKFKGFTYVWDDVRIVFLKDGLSYSDKLFVLAHELAHIVLEHTYYGILGMSPDDEVTSIQEIEANIYAYEIIASAEELIKHGAETLADVERLTGLHGRHAEHYFTRLKGADTDKRHSKSFVWDFRVITVCLLVVITIFAVTSANTVRLDNGQATPVVAPTQTSVPILPTQVPNHEAEATTAPAGRTVWITPSTNKYHKEWCSYRPTTAKELAIETAKEIGSLCLHCRPNEGM